MKKIWLLALASALFVACGDGQDGNLVDSAGLPLAKAVETDPQPTAAETSTPLDCYWDDTDNTLTCCTHTVNGTTVSSACDTVLYDEKPPISNPTDTDQDVAQPTTAEQENPDTSAPHPSTSLALHDGTEEPQTPETSLALREDSTAQPAAATVYCCPRDVTGGIDPNASCKEMTPDATGDICVAPYVEATCEDPAKPASCTMLE